MVHVAAYDFALRICSLTKKPFILQKDLIRAFKIINYLIRKIKYTLLRKETTFQEFLNFISYFGSVCDRMYHLSPFCNQVTFLTTWPLGTNLFPPLLNKTSVTSSYCKTWGT